MRASSPALPTLLIAVAGICILAGSAARLYGLERMVVWHDEVFTAAPVFGDGQSEIAEVAFGEQLVAPEAARGAGEDAPARPLARQLAVVSGDSHGHIRGEAFGPIASCSPVSSGRGSRRRDSQT